MQAWLELAAAGKGVLGACRNRDGVCVDVRRVGWLVYDGTWPLGVGVKAWCNWLAIRRGVLGCPSVVGVGRAGADARQVGAGRSWVRC